jgi:hypothetical protein
MSADKVIQLVAEDGRLCTAFADLADDTLRSYYREVREGRVIEAPVLLLCRYDAGDCDTIRWPRPQVKRLRSALFDARETGQIPDVRTVLLPNGTIFTIDL